PIDVRGEATPWVTAVFLPAKAALRIDSASDRRIAWSGGISGMLYRIEFLNGGGRCFDAITFAADYRLPASIAWRDCDSVRIRAPGDRVRRAPAIARRDARRRAGLRRPYRRVDVRRCGRSAAIGRCRTEQACAIRL